jgi:hypothetical protein
VSNRWREGGQLWGPMNTAAFMRCVSTWPVSQMSPAHEVIGSRWRRGPFRSKAPSMVSRCLTVFVYPGREWYATWRSTCISRVYLPIPFERRPGGVGSTCQEL